MIKKCGLGRLTECVEIAFAQNKLPESNCAYCPGSKDAITDDFSYIIDDPNCLMAGYFLGGELSGIFACFLNPDNNWADCVGPFFKGGWSPEAAMELFSFARAALSNAVRFNFYFNSRNESCHRLMESLSAERLDNEYILLLKKSDYIPHQPKVRIVKYTPHYEQDIVRLHDETFSDIYVVGRDIIASIGKTREVFCALDENDKFAGYGVLKFDDGIGHLTAEIFAVKKEGRGKGYGWALLNFVVHSAFKNHNGAEIDLVVDKLNTHARDLYYSCGFKLSVENEAFCIRV